MHRIDDTELGARIARDTRAWYLANARVLPWRIPPHRSALERKTPYEVLIGETILQQTTVAVGKKRVPLFLQQFPTSASLAQAPIEEVTDAWAGLGYYARARNLHKAIQQAQQQFGGVPDTESDLLSLPGVGPYTAAAVAAIAGGRRAVVVDTNIERVMARLHALETPLPKGRKDIARAAASATPDLHSGDHAQALMDIATSICTPKKPLCEACPLQAHCLGFLSGTPEAFPKRLPKKPKPTRTGIAWICAAPDGKIWLERRAETRMLGGTLGFPDTSWDMQACPDQTPLLPIDEKNTRCVGHARHTFSHFHLDLEIRFTSLSTSVLSSNRFQTVFWQDLDTQPLSGLSQRIWKNARKFVADRFQNTHLSS